MIQTNEQTTYRSVGRVVLRRIGKDQLLVPVTGAAARANCVFPLNPSGVVVWQHLSAGKTVQDAAAALAATFRVSLAIALADCEHYAGELVAQQLLEVAS